MLATKDGTEQSLDLQRGIVIFDSRYGNTEKIAIAIAAGFKQGGLQTATCSNVKEITDMESLMEYDLIVVGGPTENHTASESIKQFLARLEGLDLSRKFGFSFDTRYDFPIGTGSSAKVIEKKLKKLGLNIIFERSSAKVVEQKDKAGGVILKGGEEKRFEDIGVRVATAFLTTKRKEMIQA
ncbi:MAG: flavodoxin family protein [Thaumarchaeota archaeon]|nr:flavodoxin family protein [Nitrososphaerota archaeon]